MKPKYIYDMETKAEKIGLLRALRSTYKKNIFTKMAEDREKMASLMTDEDIWTNVARNILKNNSVSLEEKMSILSNTIPDMSIINNSILLEYEEKRLKHSKDEFLMQFA